MFEEIRQVIEDQEWWTRQDASRDGWRFVREEKLWFAIHLINFLENVGHTRSIQANPEETRSFDEILAAVDKKCSERGHILEDTALALAEGKTAEMAEKLMPKFWTFAVNEQEVTAAFRTMLQYAVDGKQMFAPIHEQDIIWAMCMYYAFTLKGAPTHLDPVVDFCLAKSARAVGSLAIEWWKKGRVGDRTKKTTVKKRETMQDREKKVLEAYDSIKREGKSLSRMAELIHKQLNGDPSVRTIYKYLTKAGKF